MTRPPAEVPGVAIFICDRRHAAPCSVPGCAERASVSCDAPVTRGGKPASCDRELCWRCACWRGDGVYFCPPHARAAKETP